MKTKVVHFRKNGTIKLFCHTMFDILIDIYAYARGTRMNKKIKKNAPFIVSVLSRSVSNPP